MIKPVWSTETDGWGEGLGPEPVHPRLAGSQVLQGLLEGLHSKLIANPTPDPQGALELSIKQGTALDIERAILAGADLFQEDYVLMQCQIQLDPIKLEMLLAHGAPVNKGDVDGWTALDEVASSDWRNPDPALIKASARALIRNGCTNAQVCWMEAVAPIRAEVEAEIELELLRERTPLALAASAPRRI